ncbi:hypothetical protein P7C70_g4521, partial [Phenoliferia sp. Uapishka_3]
MCTAETSIFYGVFVRAWTLIRAAKAYPRLAEPLLALDLIALRRRRGTLSSGFENGAGAERMPNEVWDLVRRELRLRVIKETAWDWAEKLMCEQHAGAHVREFGTMNDAEEVTRLPMNHSGWSTCESDCEWCFQRWADVVSNLGDPEKEIVEKLLDHHGLVLPLDNSRACASDGAQGEWLDHLQSWAISVPKNLSILSSTEDSTSRVGLSPVREHCITTDEADQRGDTSAIAAISPAIFTALTPAHARNLKMFIDTWSIEVAARPAPAFLPLRGLVYPPIIAEQPQLYVGTICWCERY